MSELTSIVGMLNVWLSTRHTPEYVTILCKQMLVQPPIVFVHYENYNITSAVGRVDKDGNEVPLTKFLKSYVVSWEGSFMPVQHLAMCYAQDNSTSTLQNFAGRLIGVDVPKIDTPHIPLTALQSARLLRDVVQAMANNAAVIPF